MGATQSFTGAQPDNGTAVAKTCFYEILGLEKDAADTEIKKAYRRKALELHPDRNFGDAAVATQKFAELQSAYEVLSDPHERAWYDSHRDAILSGQDGTASGAEPTSFRNIRLTSTEEIMSLMRKFHNNIPFDDEPTGFFGIARDTFEHLALEEEAAAEAESLDVQDYPSFGFSDDNYDNVVKPFYSTWTGFATKKPFTWKDKYRLSEAPDRKIRRLMEKENKKLRDEAAREFNDAVRFLVTFVRKRDPRYTLNSKSQAERVESSRNAAAAQAARSRAANQELLASYETPDWARSRANDEDEEHFAPTEDESEVEILECVVCNKSFKSDKQLQAHERSKKHLKATASLRRQMRKEGVELDLDQDSQSARPCDVPDTTLNDESKGDSLRRPSSHASEPPEEDVDSDRPGSQRPESSASSQLPDCGDYASRSAVLDRLALGSQETAYTSGGSGGLASETLSAATRDLVLDPGPPQQKKGKAKAKRERKAAASSAPDNSHKCAVCGVQYDSRTKLFGHIRQEGHATATPQAPKQRYGKAGRK